MMPRTAAVGQMVGGGRDAAFDLAGHLVLGEQVVAERQDEDDDRGDEQQHEPAQATGLGVDPLLDPVVAPPEVDPPPLVPLVSPPPPLPLLDPALPLLPLAALVDPLVAAVAPLVPVALADPPPSSPQLASPKARASHPTVVRTSIVALYQGRPGAGPGLSRAGARRRFGSGEGLL